MQIKAYGKCTGSSSSKYDIWATVNEISQDVKGNKSQVCVKAYLKRNDGYSSSAYNLYENENSVEISVAGIKKVSENLTVDTRNGKTVLLASWTGYVSHNSDGKLTVNVSVGFSMGTVGLSGGSVAAELKCTDIPRLSTGSFSSTTVNPGSTVTLTLSCECEDFEHRILWKVGDMQHISSMGKGVKSLGFTVPSSWAEAVTSSANATLYVCIYTYNAGSFVGKKLYNLSFIIPQTDEYKPQFSVSIKNNVDLGDAFKGEYIQGVSKITVEVENVEFKSGAASDSLSVKVGNVTKTDNPSDFLITDKGSVYVSATVKDSRGFSNTQGTYISVCPYSPPSVNVLKLTRCFSDGSEDTYGTNIKAEFRMSYSSLEGKNSCRVYVKYKASGDTGYSEKVLLSQTGGVFGENGISINSSYDVVFFVEDDVCQRDVTVLKSLPGANIPFNIKRGGTGAAFGKFSQKDGELSVGWDLNVSGNAVIDGELSIGGLINSENVEFECSENTSDAIGIVKYYPCLNMCYLRLRFTVKKELSAGVGQCVGIVKNKAPKLFTIVNGCVGPYQGCQSTAGVSVKTGEILLRPDSAVPVNSVVYVSGIFIADY